MICAVYLKQSLEGNLYLYVFSLEKNQGFKNQWSNFPT